MSVMGREVVARTVVDTSELRTRRLSSRMIHVSYTPAVTQQANWTSLAVLTVRYDVVHQLDAGEIQVSFSLSFCSLSLAMFVRFEVRWNIY